MSEDGLTTLQCLLGAAKGPATQYVCNAQQGFRHDNFILNNKQQLSQQHLNGAMRVPSQCNKILSYYSPAWLSIARNCLSRGGTECKSEWQAGSEKIKKTNVLTTRLWIWSDMARSS
jgi:hypothetical protein